VISRLWAPLSKHYKAEFCVQYIIPTVSGTATGTDPGIVVERGEWATLL
jgi:hypothetical protein